MDFGHVFVIYLSFSLVYSTYGKELYALVQVVNKWKHYLMGNDTNIHIGHQYL